MMTAEFMLSKRPVLRFTAALFFLLKLFSSHIYCICLFYYPFALSPIVPECNEVIKYTKGTNVTRLKMQPLRCSALSFSIVSEKDHKLCAVGLHVNFNNDFAYEIWL